MKRVRASWIAWAVSVAVVAIPNSSQAQTPFNENGASPAASSNQESTLGGTPTIDLIVIRRQQVGHALRYGRVIRDSETVELDGRKLQRGIDYQIDRPSGVIYLMRSSKVGQALRVSYRYDKAAQDQAKAVGSTSYAQTLPTYKFNIAGGSRAILGMGMAERQADGQVIMSNLYGVETKAGGLNGVLMFGERTSSDVRSQFEYQERGPEAATGKSRAILQNYKSNLNGGSIELDYQDITSNFSAFGALADSGYDQARVDQFSKERGLKRMSFGMKDVNLGKGLQISNGFRQVRDGNASVDWRSLGLKSGGFEFNYRSQRVDSDFTRFQDLAESDRDQLAREAGLQRQELSAAFSQKVGSLNFSSRAIQDADGQGISRKEFKLQAPSFAVGYKDQKIDERFTRFDSLFEAEKGQWGREAGLSRQEFALDAALKGGEMQPLLRLATLRAADGQFNSQDFGVKNNGWSLEVNKRAVDAGFTRLPSMTEGEMDAHIRTIANMQGPGIQTRPEDRAAFLQSSGLERTFAKLAGSPYKGWSLGFDTLAIQGQKGTIGVQNLALNGPRLNVSYRKQNYGAGFEENWKLMQFERDRIGIVSGLQRTDMAASLNMGANKTVSASRMAAKVGDNSAKRQSIAYSDPKLQVAVNTREVSSKFEQANQLVDPEKDLLGSLRGFKQRDVKLAWKPLANFSLDLFQFDAAAEETLQQNMLRNLNLAWNPDSKTSLNFSQFKNKRHDPTDLLYANDIVRWSISRDFGRIGKLTYLSEKIDLAGSWNQSPSSEKEYLAYETKVNQTTALKTEQTRTRFSNGDKEDVSANTVSTELSKKAGVSMTDMRIDRGGSDRDQASRNYGFWFDLGKGLRVSYGYVRQIQGAQGTLNSNLQVTPGTIDWFNLQSASYAENRWDGQNSQGLSNLAFASARPLDLFLLKNVTFGFSMDTATDQTNWVKENRSGLIRAELGGKNKIGLDYKSQMHWSGKRGIDRGFLFETDQKESNRLKGYFRYTNRQTPDQGDVMIRDMGFSYRGPSGFTLSHQLTTNPEDPNLVRQDLPMFKYTSPLRLLKWDLKWDMNKDTSLTGSWLEQINDLNLESVRQGGMTLDLFKTSGSPLSLFYGVEQRWGNVDRSTAFKWWLRYDQKPGPNQLFSIFVGNTSNRGALLNGAKRENLSLNMNWQIRF